jgi:hypothetical protein
VAGRISVFAFDAAWRLICELGMAITIVYSDATWRFRCSEHKRFRLFAPVFNDQPGYVFEVLDVQGGENEAVLNRGGGDH